MQDKRNRYINEVLPKTTTENLLNALVMQSMALQAAKIEDKRYFDLVDQIDLIKAEIVKRTAR